MKKRTERVIAQPMANGDDERQSACGSRRFLTIEELAATTTLSVSTLRRLHRRGLIVGYQPGGPRTRIIFPLDAIEQIARTSSTSAVETAKPNHEVAKPMRRGPQPKWLNARRWEIS
jgi:hypothetical protein